TEGNPDLINETLYTQPLLFLLMYSYAKLLMHLGIKPSQMIGHSLGEYVAACVGEVFTFEQGLSLILKRAELMDSMEGGTMLHVQLPASEIRKRLPESVSIAAINTTDSCVISGKEESIETFSNELKEDGTIVIPLTTSHAFHSEMMDEILDPFKEAFSGYTLSPSKIPFVSSKTGKVITQEEMTSPDYWVMHLRETVVFAEALKTLVAQGFSTFVEIGASKTLGNFLRNNEKIDSTANILTVSRHPKEKEDDAKYFLNALGALWQLGVSIKWSRLFEGQNRNKLIVPGYAFDKVLFPARVNPIQQLMDQFKANGSADLSDFKIESPSVLNYTGNDGTEDFDSIPSPVEKPELTANYAPAETETEKKLIEQWESLFGYDQIGIHDDFFELGGDSLKALTLLRRMHQTFNVEIRVEDFFDGCSIHALANEIDLATGVSKLSSDDEKSSNSEQLRF
ncbi:MAG: acyltransferase domain-containing protein, partial [Crocinitomicaceae bacterium]